MRKFTFLLIAIVSTLLAQVHAQTVCEPNMDFELGNFSNWRLYTGTCCPINATTTSPMPPNPNRFTITSGTHNDTCCLFPTVLPGGSYSLRIGTTQTNYYAEKAVYYVHVPATAASYSLIYRIAFALQNNNHSLADRSRIVIGAFDSATNVHIPGSDTTFLSDEPIPGGFIGSYGSSPISCMGWTTRVIDLAGHGGTTVKVEFAAGDCGAGGHFGYAYVDMTCGLFVTSTPVSCAGVNLAAPLGFASYAWYDSATFATFYGSAATISVTPTIATAHYAVIVTPYPGFGNPDTLYTSVNPGCTGVPTAGTAYSSVAASCPASPFTLTDTGYTPGMAYQWQSSPDSVTWSDIAGATNTTYNSPGVGADTYFRLKDSCCISGFAATSAGVKVAYGTCCSGTPVAGNATANPMYCSSCSLTLNLSGFVYAPGITYQWQYSADSLAWTNLPGATTLPYTFAPWGAFYYRCVVTCVHSGLSANSGGVRVLYHYTIAQDSVTNNIGGMCPTGGPEFYVRVKGSSPLLTLKTWYGDGTTDSIPMTSAVDYAYATHNHNYAVSGTYTVKHVVYWDNIPQDSVKYSYAYAYCHMLHLAFYHDYNGDCTNNAGEIHAGLQINIVVDSNGVTIDTLPVTSGLYYSAYGPPGTIYAFRFQSPSLYSACPASGIVYDTITTSNNYPTREFGMNCIAGGSFDISEKAVINGTGRHAQSGSIYVKNNFCNPITATVKVNFSQKYHYVYPLTTGTISGNAITWNTSLSASSATITRLDYGLDTKPGPNMPIGDTVHSSYSMTPASGDVNINNNTETRVDTVKSGYDPNFIEVNPPGCFRRDTQLEYIIHFENTGNDTAHNIHVMDTLSDNLDVNSLQIELASHEMNIALYKDGPYHIAKFDFPNIKLLDSSHHFLCDGVVVYTINTKPGLADGADIYNRAGIYFDENEVVMTNTVENIKGCAPVGVTSVTRTYNAEIYPNPASNELMIKMDAEAYASFTITNNVGQVLMQQPLHTPLSRVDIKSLSPGLYYVTLKGDNGSAVRKFVKM